MPSMDSFTVTPSDTRSAATKLSMKSVMMSNAGKGSNILRCQFRGNDGWTVFINLKPGVIYPFDIEYISDAHTNVTNIRGMR